AFRLKKAGFKVTVYEAANQLGGVIRSIRQDGYLAECGPNTILETSPVISAFIHDLGLEQRKIYSDPAANKRYVVRDGKLCLVPDSPIGFLKTPLFSGRAKAHLLAEPFVRRGNPNTEENLEQFVIRRLGREFLDYAINPFVAGVYAGDPSRLSVKEAFPKLHSIEQKYGSLILGQILGARERKNRGEVAKQHARKFSFEDGLQVLIDTLGSHLGSSVQLGTRVTGIKQLEGRWNLTLNEGRCAAEHDILLLTAPAHKLAEILSESPSVVQLDRFADIHYPPVTSVVFGFGRDSVADPLDGFGALIPAAEKMNILGVIFSSSLFPYRAPEGHVTLTCYVGGERNPELALADKSTVRRLALGDLARLLGVRGAPTFEHYCTFSKAIPQYEVGYGKFRALMNQIESTAPGIYFAGHYRDGISLGDSIVSGTHAAEKIQAFVAKHTLQQNKSSHEQRRFID
ncbi:MAG: protoporphyrinogen oxidase, partial [Limisphaerales bacterium]